MARNPLDEDTKNYLRIFPIVLVEGAKALKYFLRKYLEDGKDFKTFLDEFFKLVEKSKIEDDEKPDPIKKNPKKDRDRSRYMIPTDSERRDKCKYDVSSLASILITSRKYADAGDLPNFKKFEEKFIGAITGLRKIRNRICHYCKETMTSTDFKSTVKEVKSHVECLGYSTEGITAWEVLELNSENAEYTKDLIYAFSDTSIPEYFSSVSERQLSGNKVRHLKQFNYGQSARQVTHNEIDLIHQHNLPSLAPGNELEVYDLVLTRELQSQNYGRQNIKENSKFCVVAPDSPGHYTEADEIMLAKQNYNLDREDYDTKDLCELSNREMSGYLAPLDERRLKLVAEYFGIKLNKELTIDSLLTQMKEDSPWLKFYNLQECWKNIVSQCTDRKTNIRKYHLKLSTPSSSTVVSDDLLTLTKLESHDSQDNASQVSSFELQALFPDIDEGMPLSNAHIAECENDSKTESEQMPRDVDTSCEPKLTEERFTSSLTISLNWNGSIIISSSSIFIVSYHHHHHHSLYH